MCRGRNETCVVISLYVHSYLVNVTDVYIEMGICSPVQRPLNLTVV